MSQELLGDYAVKKVPTANYKLTFNIPDNCNYSTAIDNSVNLVTITLNDGEKDPSPVYVRCEEDYNMTNDLLTIQFKQQDLTQSSSVVYIKKPKLVISDL